MRGHLQRYRVARLIADREGTNVSDVGETDKSTAAKTDRTRSGELAISILEASGKRGVPALMPYLWTLVFIIAMLSLVYERGLDWWVAGFGALVVGSFLVVLFVIRQIVATPINEEVRRLTIAAMWFITVLFAGCLSLFISSVFFGWPLDFRPNRNPINCDR